MFESKEYSHNLLIIFGYSVHNSGLMRYVESLKNGQAFQIVAKDELDSTLKQIPLLPNNSRLFLFGHCDKGYSHLQSDGEENVFYVSFQEVAALIKTRLAKGTNQLKISLIACRSAVGIKNDITTSFAFKLTQELLIKHHIKAKISARTPIADTGLVNHEGYGITTHEVEMQIINSAIGKINFVEGEKRWLKKQKNSKFLFEGKINNIGAKEIHIFEAYSSLLLFKYNAANKKLTYFYGKQGFQEELLNRLENLNYKQLTQTINAKLEDIDFCKNLNAHKNEFFDRFFGIKNTTSFRETLNSIRNIALIKLTDRIEELTYKNKPEKALTLLKSAQTAKIFTVPINNFLPDNSSHLKQIQAMIATLTSHSKEAVVPK